VPRSFAMKSGAHTLEIEAQSGHGDGGSRKLLGGPALIVSAMALGALVAAAIAYVFFRLEATSGSGPAPAPDGSCPFGGVTDGKDYYTPKAPAFIGLNPRKGYGSGFFFKKDKFLNETYGTAPETNGNPPKTRTDLCTCDCKASDDGVGCVGFGGIAFRYVSLLTSPGVLCNSEWMGQMVAQDCGAAQGGRCNPSDPEQKYFQFIGEDRRESPGGAAIYSVATTLALTGDVISGAFRQSNGPVSCVAGLADKKDFEDGEVEPAYSCYYKCGDEGRYKEWLEYCGKGADTSSETGFSGYGK